MTGPTFEAWVSSVAPLQVLVAGSVAAQSAIPMGSYTPSQGDKVSVVSFGGRLLIVGRAS